MAKSATTAAPKRERKPARTIEQQIADLEAKRAAQANRAKTKAEKQLAEVEESISNTEPKLISLYAKRRALRDELGLDDDGAGDQFVTSDVVEQPADAEG